MFEPSARGAAASKVWRAWKHSGGWLGDGSIESFRIRGSSLKSNHDLQTSTGFVTHNTGLGPGSVQITSGGHFAVFGDLVANNQGQFTEIEVSDISSGKLTPTVDYGGAHHSNGDLGTGISSNSAVLSSDEKHIYVSNVLSGQVTVFGFDPATGVVSPGCISNPLKGFGAGWRALGDRHPANRFRRRDMHGE